MSEYMIGNVRLDDLHKVQIEIMDEVDRICRKNDISYFLSGGTLLGAVRHKGFIPWDDDIDLWMTRKNYKKFKKVLKKQLSDGYFAQDYFTELKFPLSIMKIEKKGTRFVEGVFSHLPIESCVYIDIFPLDNIWLPAYRLQTALLIKWQAVRDFKLRRRNANASLAKRIIYFVIPLRICRAMTEFTMRFFNIFPTKRLNQLCHRGRYWPKFTREDVEQLMDGDFEGKKYPIPVSYDKILTACYGDYMKLPPEDKQHPIHDIVECQL